MVVSIGVFQDGTPINFIRENETLGFENSGIWAEEYFASPKVQHIIH